MSNYLIRYSVKRFPWRARHEYNTEWRSTMLNVGGKLEINEWLLTQHNRIQIESVHKLDNEVGEKCCTNQIIKDFKYILK